ncbi:hypothetical protein BD779DRAFT_1542178 [Infundibulicybe gibba]|nr:hypothetical protein BD779DRAFT_1542178 [Infundibulicybe gibba]
MALNLRFESEHKLGEHTQFDPAYLPAEIFSNIISIACQPESWRSFILDSPCIWASLYVDLNYPVPMRGLQMFLERSGSFPLDIALYNSLTTHSSGTPPEPEAPLVATLVRALNPHIGRWRSLKLFPISETALCIAISNFRSVAESLEELVIGDSYMRHPGNDLSRALGSTFRMAMPAIRHFCISDNAASRFIYETKWVGKMDGLTKLTITGFNYEIDGDAFLKFLQDISVELTLEVLEFGGPLFDSIDLLPRLKEMRFTDCASDLVYEACMIYIEAPNLEILDFLLVDDEDTSIFQTAHIPIHGPYPIGNYMASIRSCEHLAVSRIRDIAGTLDRLGTFHDDVSSMRDPSTVGWGGEGPPRLVEGWFCPRLVSLEIYHCDGLDPSQLRNVLATRRRAFGPGSPVNMISSLVVHDEQELPGDDRAWFEANLVVFQWIRSGRPALPAPRRILGIQ